MMPGPENSPKYEQQENVLSQPERELPTPEQAEPLRPGEQDPRERLEEARHSAELSANPSEKNPLKELEKAEAAESQPDYGYTSHELEEATGKQKLQRLRRQESAPERALSRVIHQPVVRVVSEAAGKTVSRPSGMLGGGLAALLGTSAYLYLAKDTGFKYNYLLFLLLFAGGFVIGLVFETLVWLATRRRQRSQPTS